MATLQENRQTSARAISSTTEAFNGDFYALFEAEATIPAGTGWSEACLIWINTRLGTSHTNLADAQAAFAADQGVDKWDSIGTFAAL